MRCVGHGIGARVSGAKGGGVEAFSSISTGGDGCRCITAGAAFTAGCEMTGGCKMAGGCAIAAGSVGGLSSGVLGPERSAEVGRCGSAMGAGGAVTCGVVMGTADFGCSAGLGASVGAGTAAGSKLKGRLCPLGGGSGVTGDIDWSLGSSGFSVGGGVISGVSVSTTLVGTAGAGRCAYIVSISQQFLYRGRSMETNR
jgi:hypothetical protein